MEYLAIELSKELDYSASNVGTRACIWGRKSGQCNPQQTRGLRTPASALREVVREIDPDLHVFDLQKLEQSLHGLGGYFFLNLGAGFAGLTGGLGLLLAALGIYGVVAY